MDKAPAYGAGDSGFESQYGLKFSVLLLFTSGDLGSIAIMFWGIKKNKQLE
jgi:hypothetical protein